LGLLSAFGKEKSCAASALCQPPLSNKTATNFK
jgi:hypothetical protein